MRALARQMYDSLFGRLLRLDDGLELFPGHGAGSLCGRNMNSKLSTTLGFERRFNAALQPRSREDFIAWLTGDLPPPPANSAHIKRLNREGPPVLGELLRPKSLTAQAVRDLIGGRVSGVSDQREKAIVLDTRDPAEFAAGHVPGALNVALSSGQFATRSGWLIAPEQPIVLVVGREADAERAARALARVGYDRIAGYLYNGVAAWRALGLPMASLALWTAERLRSELGGQQKESHSVTADHWPLITVLDVREPSEWRASHIPGAVHIPLGQLPQRIAELSLARPTAVLCASGTRSSSAASLLAARGFRQVANVIGGLEGWQKAGYPVTDDEGRTTKDDSWTIDASSFVFRPSST
jgi:hydroxyacylglutathione hydrolase